LINLGWLLWPATFVSRRTRIHKTHFAPAAAAAAAAGVDFVTVDATASSFCPPAAAAAAAADGFVGVLPPVREWV